MSDKSQPIPLLLTLYQEYVATEDIQAFVDQVSRRYSVATLERLAGHGDRQRRRAAILALGYLGDYESNHVLGRALVDKDRGVRAVAENGIRSLWTRAGNDHQREQLKTILYLNSSKQFDAAVAAATKLIEQAPWFAEIWNQRAIAYFQLGRYADAVRDCHQALEINPYHFAAATGMGECHLKLNDPMSALVAFRRALRLNPNLEGVRAKVVYLQRTLKEK